MSYPKSMTFALSRMMGVSKNVIKRNAETTSAVSGGSTIQMKLPVNTYLDWASGFFYTDATTPSGFILPRDTTSLIESRSISAGGVAIEQPCQRSAVYHNAVADYVGWNQTTLKSVLQNGGVQPTQPGPAYVQLATNPSTNQTVNATIPPVTAVPTGASVPAGSTGRIVIPLGGDSHGLMSSSSTKIIPGQVLPEILITLQLAGNGVLISMDGATAAGANNYSFNNSCYSIDAYSFSDGFYDELIQAKVNSEEGLEINFFQLTCFQGPANQAPGTSIAQISTQSLNSVFGTLVPTQSFAAGNGNTLDTVTYQAQSLSRDGSGLGDAGTSQFLINSIPYPLQALTPAEVFVESCKSLSLNNQLFIRSHPQLNTLTNFRNHFFGYHCRFALETDEGSAYMSGLSTLGANGNIQLVFQPAGNFSSGTATNASSTAAGANFQQLIFCHTTKTLQVGPYKSLNVVY